MYTIQVRSAELFHYLSACFSLRPSIFVTVSPLDFLQVTSKMSSHQGSLHAYESNLDLFIALETIGKETTMPHNLILKAECQLIQ